VTVDVLLVVDMHEGLLRGAPKHGLLAVVERINRLAVRVRRSGGSVFFVQHAGPGGDDFEPLTPGWHLLATIKTEPGDRISLREESLTIITGCGPTSSRHTP
jgi:nicotinamidase-related amidase